jgi:hypothetical protein
VISATQVGFGPSHVEAEIGSELTLNVKLLGHLNEDYNTLVPFTDCRQSDLRFGVQDSRFFEVVTGKFLIKIMSFKEGKFYLFFERKKGNIKC